MSQDRMFNIHEFFKTADIRALIFDMDGTLIDNMGYHRRAWIEWANREGLPYSDDELLALTHGTLREIVARLFPEETNSEKLFAIGARKEALYRELYRPHLQLLPGLAEFLEEARKLGLPMAVATAGDKPNIDFTLDGLGVRSLFKAIIGAEEVSNGKPDPEVFLLAASHLGIEPKHCLVFEDSVPGAEAARRANMHCVMVNQFEPAEHFGDTSHIVAFAADYRDLTTGNVSHTIS
jgi:beta-phosphoglucomutase family hydrolase